MISKLTLSVDKEIVEMAKKYARNQGRSLSDLVESYFKVLISDEPDHDLHLSSNLKALKGVVKVTDDYDYKKELARALSKKYEK